jgi:glucose dehydrogenase
VGQGDPYKVISIALDGRMFALKGHRFSALNEINAGNVRNLRLAYTVALAGYEGGGNRYTTGNLEATPLVEDGVMYVPDGWGRVYAIDVAVQQASELSDFSKGRLYG